MGVDMMATLGVRVDSCISGEELYWTEVADVYCGRFYHWRDLVGEPPGPVSWTYMRAHKTYPIFDGMLASTHLYVLMRALREMYGPKHVRFTFQAS